MVQTVACKTVKYLHVPMGTKQHMPPLEPVRVSAVRNRLRSSLCCFLAVKAMYQRVWALRYDSAVDVGDLALFGENMCGIHSIE